MSAQNEHLTPRVGVPEPHAAIHADGGEPLSVGTERHILDAVCVPAQGPDLAAGGHVTELRDVVIAARDDRAAVRAESQAHVPVFDLERGAALPTCGGVPELQSALFAA